MQALKPPWVAAGTDLSPILPVLAKVSTAAFNQGCNVYVLELLPASPVFSSILILELSVCISSICALLTPLVCIMKVARLPPWCYSGSRMVTCSCMYAEQQFFKALACAQVFDQALEGGGAKNINFQELAADLAQITFDYPFRIPPYFALIIRAISVLEGIALVGDPDFAIVDEAYPYVAKRLLTDRSPRLQAALRYMVSVSIFFP